MRHSFESTHPELLLSRILLAEPVETEPCLPCRDIGRCSRQAATKSRTVLHCTSDFPPRCLRPPCMPILFLSLFYLGGGIRAKCKPRISCRTRLFPKLRNARLCASSDSKSLALPRPLVPHSPEGNRPRPSFPGRSSPRSPQTFRISFKIEREKSGITTGTDNKSGMGTDNTIDRGSFRSRCGLGLGCHLLRASVGFRW